MMTLNLTFADALVSLLVGILGTAIWVMMARAVPRWYERSLSWWASRSMNAAIRRMKALQLEMGQIKDFEANPAAHHARLIYDSIQILSMYALTAIAAVVCTAITVVTWSSVILKQMHTEVGVPSFILRVLIFVGVGIMLASHWRAIWLKNRLWNSSHLTARKAEIEAEFRRLQKKVEKHLSEK